MCHHRDGVCHLESMIFTHPYCLRPDKTRETCARSRSCRAEPNTKRLTVCFKERCSSKRWNESPRRVKYLQRRSILLAPSCNKRDKHSRLEQLVSIDALHRPCLIVGGEELIVCLSTFATFCGSEARSYSRTNWGGTGHGADNASGQAVGFCGKTQNGGVAST